MQNTTDVTTSLRRALRLAGGELSRGLTVRVMPGVGAVRRGLTFATGLAECLCFGALFGWSSLVFVLKAEGYFGSWCDVTPGANNATLVQGQFDNHTSASSGPQCRAQDEWFSLVFAVASNLSNVLMLPSGFLLDRFGTAVARHVAT
ncbi:Solute carrier family 43 member 3 [Liparis tanakae]|uniref:Solute carrier family 43 member 3 n=1 Tax=Liparis tanakae TaxID=230148 RepID=A0A4Z2E3N9_9TELE|nr:Solute carrier family 43 member 3 [Liparis tanakae]